MNASSVLRMTYRDEAQWHCFMNPPYLFRLQDLQQVGMFGGSVRTAAAEENRSALLNLTPGLAFWQVEAFGLGSEYGSKGNLGN